MLPTRGLVCLLVYVTVRVSQHLCVISSQARVDLRLCVPVSACGACARVCVCVCEVTVVIQSLSIISVTRVRVGGNLLMRT